MAERLNFTNEPSVFQVDYNSMTMVLISRWVCYIIIDLFLFTATCSKCFSLL